MTSFNAFQGAVAMASCLLDQPKMIERSECESALGRIVARIESLKESSPVCAKVCPVLQDLRSVLILASIHISRADPRRNHLVEHLQGPSPFGNETDSLEQWIEQNDLPGADPSEWVSGTAVFRSWFIILSIRIEESDVTGQFLQLDSCVSPNGRRRNVQCMVFLT